MANGNEFQERIPYEDLEEDMKLIGHGGFGTVYLANHKRWHIHVAIKEMRQDSPYSHKELLAEARAMDRARFLYVLRLFGLCELKRQASWDPNPQFGIVMEYMENGSLAKLQEKIQHVPWALRFQFLHQVALGMNYLHGLKPPLLHLDLKPSNVLLDESLSVRLADFGLSKFKQGTTKLEAARSEEGSVLGGTLEYMPPEALDDINYKPTQATDMYSYAILTWSVLTGEEPYPDVHPKWKSFLLGLHIPAGERPDMTKLDIITGVPGLKEMKQLMKSCWHQESSQRPTFQDCSDKTMKIFSYYNAHITQAVRMVQDMLKKPSPTLIPGCPAPVASYSGKDHQTSEGVRAASVPENPGLHDSLLPTASLGISKKFQSLHLEETPSRKNEAMPPGFEEERILKKGESGCVTLSQGTEGLNNGGLGTQEKTYTQPPAASLCRKSHYLDWQQHRHPNWKKQCHESDKKAKEEFQEEVMEATAVFPWVGQPVDLPKPASLVCIFLLLEYLTASPLEPSKTLFLVQRAVPWESTLLPASPPTCPSTASRGKKQQHWGMVLLCKVEWFCNTNMELVM